MGDHSGNIYQLRPVSIVRVLPQIKDHRLFQLKLEDGTTWESFGHQPGQFIEISIFGKGEAPISISSPPTRPETYTFPQILDNPLSLVHLLLRMAYNKREGGQR